MSKGIWKRYLWIVSKQGMAVTVMPAEAECCLQKCYLTIALDQIKTLEKLFREKAFTYSVLDQTFFKRFAGVGSAHGLHAQTR